MGDLVQPTTRSQVSGHRFLRRRVGHGLIFGDIRMIHDPLRSRSRALIFSTIALSLVLLGAGLFAWLNPQAAPYDAAIVKASSGGLYVRIDDRLHPVSNLASARLIVGAPEEPVSIGDVHLTDARKGAPLGISPAPAIFAPLGDDELPPTPRSWAVCGEQGPEITVAAEAVPELGDDEAIYAHTESAGWVLTRAGRRKLPPADSPLGTALRWALGIDASTPSLNLHPEVLETMTELPAWRQPHPGGHLWSVEDRSFFVDPDSHLSPLSELQETILVHLGVRRTRLDPDVAARHAAGAPVALPERGYKFLDPFEHRVCGREDGSVGWIDSTAWHGRVELAGSNAATHFYGLSDGAIAVDTGSGLWVISPEGLRHATSEEDLFSLGVMAEEVPWAIIKPLAQGPELSAAAARRVVYE